MASYSATPDLTMLAAREQYFDANDFGPNGGYDKEWVELEVAGIPVRFPNTQARKRAVRYHDLHHVLTGYQTDMAGESEISAWELGSNCKGFVAAWILNGLAFAFGLLTNPRRVWAAFVRGLRSENLYEREFDAALLGARVGELRAQLELDAPGLDARPPKLGERLRFVALALASLTLAALPLIALIGAALALIWVL